MKHLLRFRPLLAGATFGDRALACAGALVGISLMAWLSSLLGHDASDLPLIVAPLGASAVLLFAVPASPLAQPWSIIGGNVVSALVGVAVAQHVGHPTLAAGIAVGGAILAMSVLRCLHPPGGAAALTAVIGGPSIAAAGYGFALSPVALNSVILLAAGWLFHRFSQHSYPHRARNMTATPLGNALLREDIDRAIEEMGETFDIAQDDLELLLRIAETHAEARRALRRKAARA